jgi:hypothetical protein
MAGFAQMMQKASSQPQQVAPPTPEPREEAVDPNVLETLSRADLLELVQRRMMTQVEQKLLRPMGERLDMLQRGLQSTNIETMVEKAKQKYPDLLEWQQEITDLAKQHNTLPPEDLYTLARNKNPAKAAEMDKKFAPSDVSAKKPERFGFGGLMPSGTGTTETPQNLAPEQAADAAWNTVVASMGGEPAFQE